MNRSIRVAVVGASGYTGAELLRILVAHPCVGEIRAFAQKSTGGLPDILKAFSGSQMAQHRVESFDAASASHQDVDAFFLGLPHGAAGAVAKAIVAYHPNAFVFDLSADLRLKDSAKHVQWYGEDHAPELRKKAVYGLVELEREALKATKIVAVPGCFPTAANLACAPVFATCDVEPVLIVDAKTGISGAGRSASERTHFPEADGGVRAYNTCGKHRHTSELEQVLSEVAKKQVRAIFTPHLLPMSRGLLASCYLRPTASYTGEQLTLVARDFYQSSPMVVVHDAGANPDTLWVRGSQRIHLSYAVDAATGYILAQGAIDNLGKGAAGQAVQCMNVAFGFEETQGIDMPALWP